jgi:hypothetical protein
MLIGIERALTRDDAHLLKADEIGGDLGLCVPKTLSELMT